MPSVDGRKNRPLGVWIRSVYNATFEPNLIICSWTHIWKKNIFFFLTYDKYITLIQLREWFRNRQWQSHQNKFTGLCVECVATDELKPFLPSYLVKKFQLHCQLRNIQKFLWKLHTEWRKLVSYIPRHRRYWYCDGRPPNT